MKKPTICKGCYTVFGPDHQHYAKGYCFREYRKMRYKQQNKTPKMPKVCKGCQIPFGALHKHHAKGYCQYTYWRMKNGLSIGPFYCPKCSKYFPNDPPQKVLRENALCEKCIPIVQKILDNNK